AARQATCTRRALDWRDRHAPARFYNDRNDHRGRHDRDHRGDRVPQDPARARLDQRPLDPGLRGHGGGDGARGGGATGEPGGGARLEWRGIRVGDPLVTRMTSQGQRSAVAATDAARILDSLRAVACTARNAGSAVVWRGAVPVDSLNWHYAADTTNHWRLVLSSKYRTRQSQWRLDSMETYISCLL